MLPLPDSGVFAVHLTVRSTVCLHRLQYRRIPDGYRKRYFDLSGAPLLISHKIRLEKTLPPAVLYRDRGLLLALVVHGRVPGFSGIRCGALRRGSPEITFLRFFKQMACFSFRWLPVLS